MRTARPCGWSRSRSKQPRRDHRPTCSLLILAGTTGPQGDPAGMALAVTNVVFYAVYFVASKQAMVHIDALPFLFGVAVVAGLTVSG